MTLEDIIAELRTSNLPPADALRAAVAHAHALAPQVYALADRFCRGICLQPDDERLHFYGLHVLAAARHEGLWPRLVELARTPDEELDEHFMHHAPISLAAMMLSVWDSDTGALLRLIEHADLGDNGKWTLFDVLARLTFDGRIPRETTIAFLERYERDGLADPDSPHWWGWAGAVTKLGISALEPALRRAWDKPAFAYLDERERAESRAELHASAAAPSDPAVFKQFAIAPIADPADALEWMLRREEMFRTPDGNVPAVPAQHDTDPARSIRLTETEAYWLGRFLVSRQVPVATMPVEMIDGYLTALTIAPKPVDPLASIALVWGEDGSDRPQWEDEAQSAYVLGLIERMARAVACRRVPARGSCAAQSHRPRRPGLHSGGSRMGRRLRRRTRSARRSLDQTVRGSQRRRGRPRNHRTVRERS
jgi:hypothetical protein